MRIWSCSATNCTWGGWGGGGGKTLLGMGGKTGHGALNTQWRKYQEEGGELELRRENVHFSRGNFKLWQNRWVIHDIFPFSWESKVIKMLCEIIFILTLLWEVYGMKYLWVQVINLKSQCTHAVIWSLVWGVYKMFEIVVADPDCRWPQSFLVDFCDASKFKDLSFDDSSL